MKAVRIAPTLGDTRVRKGFLLFPKTIAGECRWFVYTAWVESWIPVWNDDGVGHYWKEGWEPTAWAGQSRVKRRGGPIMDGLSYQIKVVVADNRGYSVVRCDGVRDAHFYLLEELLQSYDWVTSLPKKGPYPHHLEMETM